MSNSAPGLNAGLKSWLSTWGPVALSVCIISLESTKYFGSDQTSPPLRWIYEKLLGPIADQRWAVLHHHIRKCGHFFGYGLIGLAWLRAWWITIPNSRFLQAAFLALLGTALMASADEFHQTFLPNRTGTAHDVLLDCAGVVALQCFVYLYLRLFLPIKLVRT